MSEVPKIQIITRYNFQCLPMGYCENSKFSKQIKKYKSENCQHIVLYMDDFLKQEQPNTLTNECKKVVDYLYRK